MSFTSLSFWIFFAAVFASYWLARTKKWQNIILLFASYVFYGAWDWRFLSLVFLTTGIDYAVGLLLAQSRSAGERKRWRSAA